MKAVIVRRVSFRLMFAALHVLLVNIWGLLFLKYKCLSQHNIHSDEQALHFDDGK
jgi:hypothetical protein